MIPINKPWLGVEEKKEIMSVLEEGVLTSAAKDGGKRVKNFELRLKDYLKAKHVVAVNSGTAALYAALVAADIKKDDEVLLPSFTFVATANSVVALGAKPVFVDVNKYDYTIDLHDLEAKISNKSKAIIPVHLFGHPCAMDEITELANKHSLKVIEDACQSVGSTYNKKQTGTLGIMGCFSMYASKVLTCGEGGAISTNNDDLAEKLKMIRNHGMVEGYDTRTLGLNLRLPEISAAIAMVQMEKLPEMLNLRRKNAESISINLRPMTKTLKISLPKEPTSRSFNWYLYTLGFEDGTLREKVKEEMLNHGIGATVYYDPPVHKTPYYHDIAIRSSKNSNNSLFTTEWSSKHVLSLPVHPWVTQEAIGEMVHVFEQMS